jgi:DNA primase large subunit
MSPVGPGDNHGCPFKSYDADIMKSSLKSQGVNNLGVAEILELVKGAHYQVIFRNVELVVTPTDCLSPSL